ncbi:unnamed protein product [Phytophthora fragariaefolia]|uniref:Unnamed protein product n=1 Tax=Phytophthora fragariaefolia TaxID=1490495 RepID=A0A9W6XC67_9STRA|nr:unnamed protein product [Phytophthora fragariaefolia]
MANRRLARWYDILPEYQPTFLYLRGAKNGVADALSRRPDLHPETKFFHNLRIPGFDPTSFTLAISECHDSNYGGHPGAERTYLTLAKRWYWSKMLKSILTYIVDCEPCRRNKPRLTKPPGLLEPLSILSERWQSISMGFITDLPTTKRPVNSIWVVVDRLTKRCHFVPTTKKVTAEGVARLFIDHIWKLHSMPTSIVSDRDRKFVSAFWQHVFKSIGTELCMTVAHRAQGDGQTERMNRTLEEYLRCFVSPLQDDWDIHLANAEFAVNSTVHPSTIRS